MTSRRVDKLIYFIYLFGIVTISLPSQAASFDCAKALLKVEKTICENSELSKLDNQLSKIYHDTLKADNDNSVLVRTQRQWLKRRNGCKNVACIERAYKERLHVILVSRTALTQNKKCDTAPNCESVLHYVESEQCNIEFDYPSNWQVTLLPKERDVTCQVQIRAKDYLERIKRNGDSEDSYTLVLQVFGLSFLWAADQSGFDFYQGEWATIGRQGMRNTATVIKTKRWSGVKGVATAGCVLSKPIDGAGVVLCNEYRAVLQDDYNDVWALSGGTDTEPVFEMILSSFTFRGK